MSQEYRELTPEEISELLEFIKEKKSQKNKIQTSEEIKKTMQEIANILGIDINRIKYKIFVSKNQEIPEVCFSIESEDDNKKLELNVQERHLLFSLQYFLAFENCKFKTPFCNRISFQYFKPLNFKNCEFEQEVNFKNCNFKQRVSFSNCKFSENIYFNNSHFCEYADFHECDFEKVACFYGVDFKKAPNFSQAVFKGNLNLINAKLNFDFEDLREKIQEEYENNQDLIKKQKEKSRDRNMLAKEIADRIKEKSLENIANDFRDSFRFFKNALIKDNNLLDASNFHRIELYCKEIELKNKQPQKFSKDWIDKWVLKFYRILCDHHTNLISNLKWLVWLVALYPIFLGKLPLFICFPYLIFILLIYFFKDKCGIFISQIFSIGIILYIICEKPKIIFGIAGLFASDLNWWQNLITAVYTILMVLVLFSLQKTARKNSIVPS